MSLFEVSARLPKRLQYFLTRFPPELYSAKVTKITILLTKIAAKEAAALRLPSVQKDQEGKISYQYQQPTLPPARSSPNTSSNEASTEEAVNEAVETSNVPLVNQLPPNPFLPRKNFTTGRWAGAKIGLREQAALVKMAKENDMEDLLPPGRKSTAFKEQRLLERGLRVRGTGEGQKVKGHKWERSMNTKLEKRREAMETMPALIREWESVSGIVPNLVSHFAPVADTHYRKATAEGGRNIPKKLLDSFLELSEHLHSVRIRLEMMDSSQLVSSTNLTTSPSPPSTQNDITPIARLCRASILYIYHACSCRPPLPVHRDLTLFVTRQEWKYRTMTAGSKCRAAQTDFFSPCLLLRPAMCCVLRSKTNLQQTKRYLSVDACSPSQ